MRLTTLCTAALVMLGSAVAAQDFGGDYAVSGTNLDGSPYEGTATITLLSDTTCQIDWVTGDTTSTGICMRNGPAFSAAYVLGDGIGLVIYQIMDDGTLDGLWTITGMEGAGTEVLTRM